MLSVIIEPGQLSPLQCEVVLVLEPGQDLLEVFLLPLRVCSQARPHRRPVGVTLWTGQTVRPGTVSVFQSHRIATGEQPG